MIKRIVVHLTGSNEDQVRINAAETLAGMFDAHLTGLLVHVEPEIMGMPEAGFAEVLQQLIADADATTLRRKADLAKRFAGMAIPNDLRIVSAPNASIGPELTNEARMSDLFVATRPYGDPDNGHRVEEAVLFGSGGPSLLLPPGKPFPDAILTVLVSWKNTRECARAIRDSLPFLQQAQRVVIAMATEDNDEQNRASSAADVARYISSHGIAPEVKELAGWHSARDALINEVQAQRPDLVVAGAYGHSRLQERLFGGVTRALLTECDVPVLMSR